MCVCVCGGGGGGGGGGEEGWKIKGEPAKYELLQGWKGTIYDGCVKRGKGIIFRYFKRCVVEWCVCVCMRKNKYI